MPTRNVVLTDHQDKIIETHGPEMAGSRAGDDIAPGVRTLHVARHGRPGRHLLLYRAGGEQIIEIGHILHDRMDLPRHSPFSDEKGE
ncbi:plasmid stabilization system protein ParE [Bradyrhizobium sp. USDA 4369]